MKVTLYIEVNDVNREILKRHGKRAGTFMNQVTKKLCFDVPFAFLPWWEAIQSKLSAADTAIRARLEELRIELRAERISYGELHELQSLVKHIAPDDVELLEAAGVPENQD
ncbi:unnamed protein product [Sphagnum tenellum]